MKLGTTDTVAGLPPLAGFFGKFYLFSAALHADANNGLLWLVALALFGSLISLYYYLIVLKVIFADPIHSESPRAHHSLSEKLALFVLAAAVLFLGLAPAPLLAQILAALP